MKTALLIIDMIYGMEEWILRKRIKKIIPTMNKLIAKARKKKIPIIYTIHIPLGRQGTRLYKELDIRKSDIRVNKTEFSSFYKTNLDNILKRRKIKRLIITGVSTHWCVMTTATDATYRKYKTVVVSDCVTAPTSRDHKNALDWMKNSLENFSIKKQRV